MFCMHKMTGEVWDPQRLVILLLKTLLCMQKPQICLGPIETSYSGPKVAVVHPKTTDEGWDP